MKEDDDTHSFSSCDETRLSFEYNDYTALLISVDSTTDIHMRKTPWIALLGMHPLLFPRLNITH
jgi:hypothetical protein